MPAAVIYAEVYDDAIEPGGESGFTSEFACRAKNADKGLLGDVFGVGPVAENAIRKAHGFLLMAVDKLCKAGFVA